MLGKLKQGIVIGFTSPEMNGSGIPPHVSILNGIQEIKDLFEKHRKETKKDITDAIEANGVAAGNVTLAQLTKVLQDNRDDDRKFLKNMLEKNGIGNSASVITTLDLSNKSKKYSYGGKFHKVPQHYTLPIFYPLPSWQLWHRGNDKIRPFKNLCGSDFNTVAEAKKFSEYRVCMIVFQNILKNAKPEMVRDNPSDIQIGKLFEVILREIRSRIPLYNRIDAATRKRKRRSQAVTTYMKHIRSNRDKFPEYVKQTY